MSDDSKATEATEATGAEEPRPDYHVVTRGAVDIVVFVNADGGISIQTCAAGLHVSLRIPVAAVPAFARAVSTPYSGGIDA